ncbi:sensor histidine kinase [Paenibacillus sp. sptzw28]|uniref:sensor histidine kinase n=1 Tax=Paenibacillus sp. sptzw28 TaxID=715179 RepID=UPI001C6F24EB|nr:sensor histidine kinase [Paenibacillus sp. sptzw28]QYR19533.1 sensor histidine kinase [Paenibacillus sp. sptzw28]
MKLFLREQLPLFYIYLAQLLVITLIYRLDGHRSLAVSLYACLLSGCLFIGYLIYRYLTNRSFYNRMENPLAGSEDFAGNNQQTPLAEGLQHLLKSQFRHYQKDILRYRHKIDDHIQFINQWVHQMKTPVSVIHLMIQNEDEPRLHAIGDELDKLKKGLEMVLYTARLDAFEHDFVVEALDLETIIRTVTSSQKRLFIRSRIFPVIRMEGRIGIASDEKWLSFVITQLITNAVRYTVEDNRKIHFHGYIHGVNGVLEIQDEGVGIPAGDLPRIFDPYFTGENGRNFQESTGMGLYLVKQICGKLGHRVELESTAGEGTVVRIIFNLTKL